MSEVQHTTGPSRSFDWKETRAAAGDYERAIRRGFDVGDAGTRFATRAIAHWPRIVQCVNAHDGMVAALQHFIDNGYDREMAIRALASSGSSRKGEA